jgi:chromosome segregation ATPase
MEEDDPILVRRALARETNLKNLAKRIASVYSIWCRQNNAESQQEELVSARNALGRELTRFELNLKKLVFIGNTTICEDQQLQATERQLEDDIRQVELEVQQLKRQLQIEKTQRRRKEEYSLIAASIMELPDREKLQQEIEQTMKEIQQLEQQRKQLESEKDQRARQFQLLLQSIKELSSQTDDSWYKWWKEWFTSNTQQQDTSSISYGEDLENKETSHMVRMEES